MNAIFYIHHCNEEFAQKNFLNIKELNPGWDVYSIGFKGNNLLPGSLYAEKDEYAIFDASKIHNVGKLTKWEIEWMSADLLCCEAYTHKPQYDYYFFIEWDTICNVPVLDFFDIEGCEYLGSNVRSNPPQDWIWIKCYEEFLHQYRDVSIYDHEYGDGGQTACMCFNNATLKNYKNEIIKNKYLYDNMFSELRLGTVLKKYTTLKNLRPDILDYISWTSDWITYDFSKPYFYHPKQDLDKLHGNYGLIKNEYH